jgi:hypothetical protein
VSPTRTRRKEAKERVLAEHVALPPGTVSAALERLFPQPSVYERDPVRWVHDKLGRCLWSKQVEILEAIRDNRMVAVKSCHGPGKTFTASCAGAWWLDPETHPLGSAFLVTTAPSWPQVEAILWRELKRRYIEGKLRGRITLDCVWHMGQEGTKRGDATEEIIGLGRKPADYDENTFQGIHTRYFMAELDEANGIPEALWNSVLSLVTNDNARVLAIGNPDDPNSRFAQVCKPGSGWVVIQISVFDTPHFTGELDCAVCGRRLPDDMLESLVGPMWVEDRRRDWGEGSPIWVSKVLGEFPDISDEYLFPPALIERAQRNDLSGLELGRFGADIARYGSDKSVLYHNRGGQIRVAQVWAKEDTMQSAGRIARVLRSFGDKRPPANIDIIGIGSGVYDRLREQRLNVAPYQGSQRALNPAKFRNRRSEAWWSFKDLMEADLIDLDPADEQLAADLGAVKWGTDSTGRIYIETKEDMIERLGRSPNHADAAIMSTCEAGAVAKVERQQPGEAITSDLLHKVM